MPRVLFLVNRIEHGSYLCHARVEFASAPESQEFLARNSFREKNGWGISINRGPSRGYDGKPLHHADVYLSAPLPPLEPSECMVKDSGLENTYGTDVSEERPADRRREHLTWEERNALQKATKALLLELGITDLGRWR